MPLEILLPIVVLGIAGITIFLHLSGHSKRIHFADDNAARLQWVRNAPDTRPTDILRNDIGDAALVSTDHGAGLLWAMGADSTAHMLAGAHVAAHDHGLKITFPDFASPAVILRLTPSERGPWRAAIEEKIT